MILLDTAINELRGTSTFALWTCQTCKRECSQICILSHDRGIIRQKRAATSLICENFLFLDKRRRQIELSLRKCYRSEKAFDKLFQKIYMHALNASILMLKYVSRYAVDIFGPFIQRIHLGRLPQTPRQNTYFPLPLAVIY